jgi:3',5'-cyclic AMP phosphodiesterase CpdA
LASKEGSEACRCKTIVGDSKKSRIAALYLSHSFTLPEGALVDHHQILELRVAYRDGVNAFLNGVPIATRNLDSMSPAGPAVAPKMAARPRGPEWETFSVPVRSGLLHAGSNVLSFEVRPSANRHGVRFDASLSLRKAGKIVRGPILQQVDETSALVLFDTDVPTRAQLSYGATKDLGMQVVSASGGLARHHQFRLANLKAGQAVHYRIDLPANTRGVQRFHLAPGAKEPLRFAVYGDMRGGHMVHGKIVKSLLEEAVDFVIVTGDLVLRGSDEADWQRFFDVAQPLLARLPDYPVAGNHDAGRTGDEQRRMNEIFAFWPGPDDRPSEGHWYSFDVSGVHFVMLDSNNYRNSEQLAWLKADLVQAKKRGSRALFAAVHAGPYSRGLHLGNRLSAETYAPILAAHGVTLLFSGHDHLYQRGAVKGLNYMVSGGGGAPLYSVRCGVRGKKRCKDKDGMQHVAREHHYVLISVYPKYVEACPKRLDRSPLEACTRYRLQGR